MKFKIETDETKLATAIQNAMDEADVHPDDAPPDPATIARLLRQFIDCLTVVTLEGN